jgi:hypothetical protein
MSDDFLQFDDGEVWLGQERLSGMFVSISINAGIRFDRAERDHMSGKNKIPLGWEDADVKITMDLLCDERSDCFAKLKNINGHFKSSTKGASPKIFDVTNRHLNARGVNRVVFSGLQSDDDDQSDVIRVVLAFSEHLPAVIKREQAANAAPPAAPKTKANPAPAPKIVKDDNPFMAGFFSGNN